MTHRLPTHIVNPIYTSSSTIRVALELSWRVIVTLLDDKATSRLTSLSRQRISVTSDLGIELDLSCRAAMSADPQFLQMHIIFRVATSEDPTMLQSCNVQRGQYPQNNRYRPTPSPVLPHQSSNSSRVTLSLAHLLPNLAVIRQQNDIILGTIPSNIVYPRQAYKYYDNIRDVLCVDVLRDNDMECLMVGLSVFCPLGWTRVILTHNLR